jgi:hypothetical protein
MELNFLVNYKKRHESKKLYYCVYGTEGSIATLLEGIAYSTLQYSTVHLHHHASIDRSFVVLVNNCQ